MTKLNKNQKESLITYIMKQSPQFLEKLANLGYYTVDNLPNNLTEDGIKCITEYDTHLHSCSNVYTNLLQLKIECAYFFKIRQETNNITNKTFSYLENYTPYLIAHFNTSLIMFKQYNSGRKLWIAATNEYFNNHIHESHNYYYDSKGSLNTTVEPNKIGVNSVTDKKVLQWLEYCDNMQKLRIQLHEEHQEKLATIRTTINEYVERAKRTKSFIRHQEYKNQTSLEFKLFYLVFTIDQQYATYVSRTDMKGQPSQILELLERLTEEV